jgi:thiamine biosynthesis lipoprotein
VRTAPGAFFLGTLLAACASPAPPSATPVHDGRYVMGTVLEITLPDLSRRDAERTLAKLFEIAERLDALMTSHDSLSQISRLNRAAGQGPITVDPELADLLRRSVGFSALTDGSFDVTVGPLVELWIEAAVKGVAPSAAEVARVRARIGASAIVLHAANRVELARRGVRVDLGGVAKGFALDRMRRELRGRNVDNALINFGQSSTLALGEPPDAPGWRLLVRGPDTSALGLITLRDQSLSVSSSFGHWVEIEGRRYGHVIDPRSGMPLTRALQAHVVAPSASLAEALSKALLILAPERGIDLIAAQPDCEGLLVDAAGRQHKTPGWDAATRWEALTPPAPQAPGPVTRSPGHDDQGSDLPRLQRGPAAGRRRATG